MTTLCNICHALQLGPINTVDLEDGLDDREDAYEPPVSPDSSRAKEDSKVDDDDEPGDGGHISDDDTGTVDGDFNDGD